MNQEKIAHLQLVQQIIARLDGYTFQIKGWTIIVGSALFSLSAAENKGAKAFLLIAIVATVIFWLLDAYYLSRSIKYEQLYTDLTTGDREIEPFSLEVEDTTLADIWDAVLRRKSIVIYFSIAIFISIVRVLTP